MRMRGTTLRKMAAPVDLELKKVIERSEDAFNKLACFPTRTRCTLTKAKLVSETVDSSYSPRDARRLAKTSAEHARLV